MPDRARHRPRDYLPRELHDAVYRIGGARHHNLAAYWHGAIASATALAAIWIDLGRPGDPPLPPAMAWSDVDDPVEIRWTQTRAEETEHLTPIKAVGSSRTAVLRVAAHRYAHAGGDLIALMRETPGQLTPGPLHPPVDADLLALLGRCPPGCPLAVSDPRPGWRARLLSPSCRPGGDPERGSPAP